MVADQMPATDNEPASSEGNAMAAYFIAEIEVTNPTEYDRYRPLAGATIAQYGGKFLCRGGKVEILEGGGTPKRLVVIEFADSAAAHRWYDSPEYQEALKIRLSASTGRVMLVEG
jgi:uncharacterized protein (DUF1330 family)